ncbi:MAG: biotin transporter BioY [Bacilli bacterium]|nr:biotin transporter BioY [Bacilli bacterium]
MNEENKTHRLIQRITRNAFLLALLCVVGMFSIPLGEHIKVSLQLWVVFLICFLAEGFLDCLLITGCYLLLGLFLPIYAGFSFGISPTFGFVISFVVASPLIYFLNRYIPLPKIAKMAIASLAGLLIVYAIGSLFMCLYLEWSYPATLMVAVVPYLPFDAIKIVLAILTMLALPEAVKPEAGKKSE